MLSYVTLGTNDLARATAFYDALFAELGAKRIMEMDRMIIWGTGMDKPMFAICTPYDGKPATTGNGTMVALATGTKEIANKVHARALELGGKDEGAPGPRGEGSGFYAGYFRDLDGNKLNAWCMTK